MNLKRIPVGATQVKAQARQTLLQPLLQPPERRPLAVGMQRADDGHARARRLERVVMADLSGQQQVCLLYTSDAADDMQCVDLGGRRIIKKKVFFKQKTAYEMS